MVEKEDLGLSLSLSFPQNHHSLQLNLRPSLVASSANSCSSPSGLTLQKPSWNDASAPSGMFLVALILSLHGTSPFRSLSLSLSLSLSFGFPRTKRSLNESISFLFVILYYHFYPFKFNRTKKNLLLS